MQLGLLAGVGLAFVGGIEAPRLAAAPPRGPHGRHRWRVDQYDRHPPRSARPLPLDLRQAALREALSLVERGELEAVIGQTFALESVAEAHPVIARARGHAM